MSQAEKEMLSEEDFDEALNIEEDDDSGTTEEEAEVVAGDTQQPPKANKPPGTKGKLGPKPAASKPALKTPAVNTKSHSKPVAKLAPKSVGKVVVKPAPKSEAKLPGGETTSSLNKGPSTGGLITDHLKATENTVYTIAKRVTSIETRLTPVLRKGTPLPPVKIKDNSKLSIGVRLDAVSQILVQVDNHLLEISSRLEL